MSAVAAELTEEQQRLLQVLDFRPAPLPCEVEDAAGRKVCAGAAAWIIRCKFCRDAFLLCHDHKRELVQRALARRQVCMSCKAHPPRLDDLVDILPVGSAL